MKLPTLAAMVLLGSAFNPPLAHADPEQPCCDSEFDWAAPYADAMRNHGIESLMSTMGITSALAMEDACGLVPAIGAVATINNLTKNYPITAGQAGQLVVAAADVCPDIRPMLG